MNWRECFNDPVLHVVIVGFHHKKGCQVEYAYPPLIEGNSHESNECPKQWKHLPSLALPDGAHNYSEDTIYFHLPSLANSSVTIYGVSCYRQIDASEVINKQDDVTRNTVQKSVCILSKLPVYGLIQVKLEMITHAYFVGRDFGQVDLMKETYETLNKSLIESLSQHFHVHLGLSCRDILKQFKHKLLILFKLLMLEKKVLFFSSPVKPICTTILTLVSLFPEMLENGLTNSSDYIPIARTSSSSSSSGPQISGGGCGSSCSSKNVDSSSSSGSATTSTTAVATTTATTTTYSSLNTTDNDDDDDDGDVKNDNVPNNDGRGDANDDDDDDDDFEAGGYDDDYGMPLSLFTKGVLCHPYLSLHLYDILSDACVRGFVIGATNALFMQRKQYLDVIVELAEFKVEILDPELKKALQLSTADLRFIDNLVKCVDDDNKGDPFLDNTGWEGGDDWVRSQFKSYLLSLLATVASREERLLEDFNTSFISAWKLTNNYKQWQAKGPYQHLADIKPEHVCKGQLSMSDVKLKINQVMNLRSGNSKKINAVVNQTEKVVSQTGKAVGAAVGLAKSTVSSWFSGLTAQKEQ
ncbi:hypothetical protein HELRODRAFT_186563 [Helobdella robusta]|uniref:UDENN domain-containing protein n=1 Tax=Helobdella robusta TaxID=6412 RepID=T1FP12_HELRO|nr:hypothetical protein HELRODRAFT_186563 [Helobdella robusta]ESN92581.1 hypothetical protein HELRODRAFT_186563 [Helobdella robusta]